MGRTARFPRIALRPRQCYPYFTEKKVSSEGFAVSRSHSQAVEPGCKTDDPSPDDNDR